MALVKDQDLGDLEERFFPVENVYTHQPRGAEEGELKGESEHVLVGDRCSKATQNLVEVAKQDGTEPTPVNEPEEFLGEGVAESGAVALQLDGEGWRWDCGLELWSGWRRRVILVYGTSTSEPAD